MDSLEATSRTCINGIDLDSVAALASRATHEPGAANAEFRVLTCWKGRRRSESTVTAFSHGGKAVARNFTIAGDQPAAWLGDDAGPSPVELLLSALGSGMVAAFILQSTMRGIPIRSCRIVIEAGLDLGAFLGLVSAGPVGPRIHYVVHVEGGGTRRQYQEILAAMPATCPCFSNMARPIEMCGTLI